MTRKNVHKFCKKLFASIAFTLCVSSLAVAQGTITDGASNFAIGTTGFDTTPASDFRVPNPAIADHLFEQGWWFRVSGDGGESFFPAPNTQSYVGNEATLDWTNVNGRNFAAHLVATIKSGSATSSRVQYEMTITNNTGSNLNIELFHMADLDLRGTAATDVATLVTANNRMALTDTGGSGTAEYYGENANAYLVRTFSSTTDVAAVLSDASVTNFDNSGLPFASGDFTGGYQFSRSIPNGGSTKVTVVLAVNELANTLTEACILPDLSCQVLNQSNCSAGSGNYFADSTCLDSDGDGRADLNDLCPVDPGKFAPGACGCGVADSDSDGDSTLDCNDSCPLNAGKTSPGICGCGFADADSDGDGTLNCLDICSQDARKTSAGICGCGVADVDSNSNGAIDCVTSSELKARLATITKLVKKLKLKDGAFTKTAKVARKALATETKSMKSFISAQGGVLVLSNPKASLSKLSNAIASKVGKARKGSDTFADDKKAALKAIKNLDKLVK